MQILSSRSKQFTKTKYFFLYPTGFQKVFFNRTHFSDLFSVGWQKCTFRTKKVKPGYFNFSFPFPGVDHKFRLQFEEKEFKIGNGSSELTLHKTEWLNIIVRLLQFPRFFSRAKSHLQFEEKESKIWTGSARSVDFWHYIKLVKWPKVIARLPLFPRFFPDKVNVYKSWKCMKWKLDLKHNLWLFFLM